MGRKKKIELLEKPEPSKSLPNYEFERRKWEAYNDLREGSSYRKAAAQHKISYRCLFDYARGKKNRVESHERYMALPVELENELSNRIATIVEESGVFPQQKVISQLANDLIRQNESANSNPVNPSSSSASSSSSSSATGPPIPSKPAVSDTWVSKFLRRHPELNYERRGKRRKVDSSQAMTESNPTLTPVIINTQYSYPNLPYSHLPSPQSISNPHYSQSSHVPPPIPSGSHPYQPYHSSPASPHIYQRQPQQTTQQPHPSNYNYNNYTASNVSQPVLSAPPSIGSESNTANLATYTPRLEEDKYIYKCLNEWYGALNATMDTFSIQPSNVYNSCCLNLTVDDEQGCILSRNIAARVSSSPSTAFHSTIPFVTNSAYGISVFECICSDGSTFPPAVISPTPLKSNGYQVLKCTTDEKKSSSRIPRVARSNFFTWLKDHFEPTTRTKADNGKEWRVLITEETPSIDLFFFLWAFQHKILIVVIPAKIANATQPFDKGNIINTLRNKLVTSLTLFMKQCDIEMETNTVLVGTNNDDISRRNSAPSTPTSNNSSATTRVVTTISPTNQFSLSRDITVARLMDIYMGVRTLSEGIQEAWKSSGIVPRNPVLVMNTIGQIPVIEPKQYLIKFVQGSDSVLSCHKNVSKNEIFPSVSMMERGIEIYHDDQLTSNDKVTMLFQLLESSFDRAVGCDLSLKRRRLSDATTTYDDDYDYQEAEQILEYGPDFWNDNRPKEISIKQEHGEVSSDGQKDSKVDTIFSMPSDSNLSSKLRMYLHPSRSKSETSPMTIDQVTMMMKFNGFNV